MKASGFKPEGAIDVALINGKYIIIDGYHRARAAGAVGIQQVPVRVWDVSQETDTLMVQQAAEAADRLGLIF